MVTVAQLRKSGYKVRVLHSRNTDPDGTISCMGGRTTVEITTPDGRDLSGSSKCRDDEKYCKRMGVEIALGRAMSGSYSPCRPNCFTTRGGPCGLVR